MSACETCLRRAWLLGRLSGSLEIAWRQRRHAGGRGLLGLDDAALVAALRHDASVLGEADALRPDERRRAADDVGLATSCRHGTGWPRRLLDLDDPPAALHHDARGPAPDPGGPVVGVVGARRATPTGLDVARELGAGLAEAGVTVVSGMALGVDSAAHEGALAVGGPTIAVLPGGADVAYPASRAALHARLRAGGQVLAELPPGTAARRWTFPARNRIVAALADVVVVVEAAARSGSLITARRALALGRDVAAVPGPVRGGRCDGGNALLHDGAHVVRDAADAIALLGSAVPPPPRRADAEDEPAAPARAVLARVRAGTATLDELLATGPDEDVLVALAELEAAGRVRRGADGGYRPGDRTLTA